MTAPSGKKILFGVLVTPIFLWLIYLAGVNGFFAAGGFGFALSGEKDVDGWVGSAYSYWPGHVSGTDFHLVVHDPAVEAHLAIDSFRLRLDLLALLKKRLHIHTIEADGARFWLRKTRPLRELCKNGSGLPPIPGLARPPGETERCLEQRETAREPGPKPDPERLLRVRLDHVLVRDLEELWLEHYRVDLDARLEGAWYFWPTRETAVSINGLRIREASSSGPTGARFARLAASLSGGMDLFDLERPTPKAVWSALRLDGWIAVPDVDLSVLRRGLLAAQPIAPPSLPPLTGRASATATLTVDGGQASWVKARLRGRAVGIGWDRYLLRAEADAALRLEPADGEGHALVFREGRVLLSSPVLKRPDGTIQRYPKTRARARIRATSRVDPMAGHARLGVDVLLNRSELLIDLIPSELPRLGANLLTGGDEPVRGEARLEVEGDAARIESLKLSSGALEVTGRVRLAPSTLGDLDIRAGPVTVGHRFGEAAP